MKRQRNIVHVGPHTINNKWLGEFNERTEGIIIESTTTREGQRQIKPMRTEKINLLVGELTVAVFRITKRHEHLKGQGERTPKMASETDAPDLFS